MKTISVGYEGLDADTKAALIKACVDVLGDGSIMIDRDEHGADITLLEVGDSFGDVVGADQVENTSSISRVLISDPAFDSANEAVKRAAKAIKELNFPRLGEIVIRHGLYMPPASGEAWVIECQDDSFVFKRLVHGYVHEEYRSMKTDEALLAAVSVIQGFQPPRKLVRLD